MENVIITGSNMGIGLEMVKYHIKRGDHVIALCRKASVELEATGAEIIKNIDMADDISINQLKETITPTSINRVIANAGMRVPDQYNDINFDNLKYQYDINALGPLRLITALDNKLKDGSKIVLISTRVASLLDNNSGGEFGYRMSKTALNMAGVNLSHALKSRNIVVLLLHPGFVRTNLTDGEGVIDALESAQALVSLSDRLGMPETGTFWHAITEEKIPW